MRGMEEANVVPKEKLQALARDGAEVGRQQGYKSVVSWLQANQWGDVQHTSLLMSKR